MVICTLCQQSWPDTDCQVVTLTEEEVVQLKEQGHNPPSQYTYCKPCWKVLSNPVSGPAVLRGLFEHHLKRVGVVNAEELADKYHKRLVEMALAFRPKD